MNARTDRDQAIDELAAEYLPGGPPGMVEDLIQSDQTLLLYAVLRELRALRQDRTGGRPIGVVLDQQESDETNQEANLYANSDVQVTGADQEAVEFGFASKAVLVWGWDQDITIAFQKSGSNREIDLAASKSSFSIGGDVDLGASRMWYSKQNGGDPDTTLKVVAQ
jgi:hypothetical protein